MLGFRVSEVRVEARSLRFGVFGRWALGLGFRGLGPEVWQGVLQCSVLGFEALVQSVGFWFCFSCSRVVLRDRNLGI